MTFIENLIRNLKKFELNLKIVTKRKRKLSALDLQKCPPINEGLSLSRGDAHRALAINFDEGAQLLISYLLFKLIGARNAPRNDRRLRFS